LPLIYYLHYASCFDAVDWLSLTLRSCPPGFCIQIQVFIFRIMTFPINAFLYEFLLFNHLFSLHQILSSSMMILWLNPEKHFKRNSDAFSIIVPARPSYVEDLWFPKYFSPNFLLVAHRFACNVLLLFLQWSSLTLGIYPSKCPIQKFLLPIGQQAIQIP
jgi:hypothetical protein